MVGPHKRSKNIYCADWINVSPVTDRKRKFYLDKFVYKSFRGDSEGEKTKFTTIAVIEIFLACFLLLSLSLCLNNKRK